MAQLKANTRIYGNTTVDSILVVGNTISYVSASNTSGTLIVSGGIGATGNIYAGNVVITGGTANGLFFRDGTSQFTTATAMVQAAYGKANAEGSINTTQNTNITSINTLATAAFGRANSALSNTTGAIFAGNLNITGNVGIGTTSPNLYAQTGRVLNITGLNNNNRPAHLFMVGADSQPGAGYSSTEVFAISGITSNTEITRVTGTNTNGFRAYIKVIATGHTDTIGSGINIKEWFWDGGTSGVTEISSYTNGSFPVLSVTNSTSHVLIINLSSSNQTNSLNGVMKVEWLIPIDFSSSTYTIS